MENYKKHPSKKPARPTLIDGFLAPRREASGSIGRFPTRAKTPLLRRAAPIDDFRKKDGFSVRTSENPTIPDGTSMGRRSIDVPRQENQSQPAKKIEKKRGQKKWKKLALRSFSGLTAVILLGSGFLFGTGYLKARQIFKGGAQSALALNTELDPSKLKAEGDGRINILLLGKGGPGHDGADLTDTILIASIDPLRKDAGLLSIPRDLYVKSPAGGSMKINAVYATAKQNALAKRQSLEQAEAAGIDNIEKTVEQVLGIPMNYYAMVDFEAFRKAIDTVGGVTIDVPEQLYDPSVAWENNWNSVIAPKGVQTFDGKRALLYARSRHGSARGDFDRSERQRQILVALREKVFSLGTFGNPVKLTQLIDTFGNHVRTNMNINEIMSLYGLAKDIDGSKLTSIGLADPPNDYVTTGNVGGLSVVVPRAGSYNYAPIQNYVRNTLKDGFIRKENASILVLNGTETPGLATTTSDTLKSYGYNVIGTGDAPTKGYTVTQVINLKGRDKKYTQRYLELRFKTSAGKKLPEGVLNTQNADFVIIVGK